MLIIIFSKKTSNFKYAIIKNTLIYIYQTSLEAVIIKKYIKNIFLNIIVILY